MTFNQQFFDSTLRHQIDLLRYGAGVSRKVNSILDETRADLKKQVEKRLGKSTGFDSSSVRRLAELERAIDQTRSGAWNDVNEQWKRSAIDVALEEPPFVAGTMTSILPVELDLVMPSDGTLRAIATTRPFQGRNLKEWADSARRADLARIHQQIRIGMVQGESSRDIANRVFGARGAMSITANQADAVTRTAINHVSNAAQQEFLSENADLFDVEQLVATLDARTTPICQAQDGRQYPVGKGPIPPLHVRCRSIRVGVIDGEVVGERPFKAGTEEQMLREYGDAHGLGPLKSRDDLPRGTKRDFDAFSRKRMRELTGQVPAHTTYQQWLSGQSAAFQDDVLGPTKGKLFRDGGLTLDKFVNRQGDELTLDEIRERNKEAWGKAGVGERKAPESGRRRKQDDDGIQPPIGSDGSVIDIRNLSHVDLDADTFRPGVLEALRADPEFVRTGKPSSGAARAAKNETDHILIRRRSADGAGPLKGEGWFLVDGSHRLQVARELGIETLPTRALDEKGNEIFKGQVPVLPTTKDAAAKALRDAEKREREAVERQRMVEAERAAEKKAAADAEKLRVKEERAEKRRRKEETEREAEIQRLKAAFDLADAERRKILEQVDTRLRKHTSAIAMVDEPDNRYKRLSADVIDRVKPKRSAALSKLEITRAPALKIQAFGTTVNADGYYDPNQMSLHLATDVAVLKKDLSDKVFSTGDVAKDRDEAFSRLVAHEYGHHIHMSAGDTIDSVVKKAYRSAAPRAFARSGLLQSPDSNTPPEGAPTRYGTANHNEFWAESFTSYHFDRDWLRANKPQAFEMVETVLNLLNQ